MRVINGKDLLAEDFGGTSDPYVIVSVDKVSVSTRHISNTLHPAWNEQMSIGVMPAHLESAVVSVEVHDRDRGRRDELLGKADVSFADIPALRPKQFVVNLDTQGTLTLQFWVTGPGAKSGGNVAPEEESHPKVDLSDWHGHEGHHGPRHDFKPHPTHATLVAQHKLHTPNLHEILPDGSLVYFKSQQSGKHLRFNDELEVDVAGGKEDACIFEVYHEGDGFLIRSFAYEECWLSVDGGEVCVDMEEYATIFTVHGRMAEDEVVGLQSECGTWLSVLESGAVVGKANVDNKIHPDVGFLIEHADE